VRRRKVRPRGRAADMRWLRRDAFTAAACLMTALLSARDAAADCMSDCQSGYHSCTAGFNERDCATTRSICQHRCVMRSVSKYGAIAYSPSTGGFGFSFKYASRPDAEGRATRECLRQVNKDDCKVEIWFHDACAALAEGESGIRAAASAPSQDIANRAALENCKSDNKGERCEVKVAVCSE